MRNLMRIAASFILFSTLILIFATTMAHGQQVDPWVTDGQTADPLAIDPAITAMFQSNKEQRELLESLQRKLVEQRREVMRLAGDSSQQPRVKRERDALSALNAKITTDSFNARTSRGAETRYLQLGEQAKRKVEKQTDYLIDVVDRIEAGEDRQAIREELRADSMKRLMQSKENFERSQETSRQPTLVQSILSPPVKSDEPFVPAPQGAFYGEDVSTSSQVADDAPVFRSLASSVDEEESLLDSEAAQQLLAGITSALVPQAVADSPPPDAENSACYSDTADMNANLTADLDLDQKEMTPLYAGTSDYAKQLGAGAFEIQVIAQLLDYSPLKIYEYVVNNTEFAHYSGGAKGAVGTLWSESGNDIDQASLLIALLRASNIPARYVKGKILLEDLPEHYRWWQTSTFEGMHSAVRRAGQKPDGVTTTHHGRDAIVVEHVWVEACVPYSAYRGTVQNTGGRRWIPLDPSFKRYTPSAGLVSNTDLNYNDFLEERTKKLAHEVYIDELLAKLRETNDNVSLNDVGVSWRMEEVDLEFLPNSLPYVISTFDDWGSGVSDGRTAELPSLWEAAVKFEFKTPSMSSPMNFELPLRLFSQHRVTFGASGAVIDDYRSGNAIACQEDDDPIAIALDLKVDGVSISTLYDINLPTMNLCEGNLFGRYTLASSVWVNGGLSVVSGAHTITETALEYLSLQAHTLGVSNRFLAKLNKRLLDKVAANATSSSPWDDPDGIVGEYLNLVGLKYWKYNEESARLVGKLYGQTGRMGHGVGITKVRGDIFYLDSFPYALQSNEFVIDVASRTLNVKNDGGPLIGVYPSAKLTGFTQSHYESYVWQENALKDAVSTVSGLQISTQNETPVGTYDSYAGLVSVFGIKQCEAVPEGGLSWPSNTELATMVEDFRSAGFFNDEVLRDFFIGEMDNHSTYSTEAEIQAQLDVEYDFCYTQTFLSQLKADFDASESFRVTIPIVPLAIPLDDPVWVGTVYYAEQLIGGKLFLTFKVGPYGGGYTVPTPAPVVFNPDPVYQPADFNSNGNIWSTGYRSEPVFTAKPSDFDVEIIPTAAGSANTSLPSVLNSAQNYGNSGFETYAFDPVNMVTGNMYHEETDFELPTRGLPFVFKRTYNSRSTDNDVLGKGWTHSFNQSLKFVGEAGSKPTDIVWTTSDGGKRYIKLSETVQLTGDGALNLTASDTTIPDGFYFTLTRPHTSGNRAEFVLAEKSGIVYRFQAIKGTGGQKAKLVSVTDRNGNALTLKYLNAPDGRLNTVSDPDGRVIQFRYAGASARVASIETLWTGDTYRYDYNTENQLTSYRNPVDQANSLNSSEYQYNADDRMESFEYANGYKMTFEYYRNGKVYRHYDAEGDTATFTYNDYRREATSINQRGDLQRYIFNPLGLPLEIVEADGSTTRYKYEDPNDPMLRTSVINAMGYETTYAYDSNGNLLTETLPSGHTVEYEVYTSFGQPQIIKNAEGDYRVNLYDSNGNLTDARAFVKNYHPGADLLFGNTAILAANTLSWTKSEYDSYGKLIVTRQVDDFSDPTSGPSTTFSYDDTLNGTLGVVPVSVTYNGDIDGNGVIDSGEGLGTYTSKFDADGRLLQGYDANFYPVSYRYDAAGRLLEGTDANGNQRRYGYDASGLLTSETLISVQGGVVSVTDSSSQQYDLANRLLASSDNSGATTRYEYDSAGNPVSVTSPDGYVIRFDYDERNRVLRAYDEEGNAAQREVDALGRMRTLTDPNGNVTTYTYYGAEENGRLSVVKDPEGRWTLFKYNATGQVIQTTQFEPASFTPVSDVIASYDALGRVTRVVQSSYYDEAVGGMVRPVTSYSYNALGQQTSVSAGYTQNSDGAEGADVMAANPEATYTYDDFGRLLTETNAAGKVWQMTYDEHNNVKTSQDPNGNLTNFEYYYGGVLRSKTTTGSLGTESISYTRNQLGQPVTVTTPTLTTTYSYDSAHRVATKTDSRMGKSITYDYSVGGLLNSITDSDGHSTAYQYDPVGRLTGVRSPNKALTSYLYDGGGRLREKIFPNAVQASYDYYSDNQIKEISVFNRDTQAQLANFQYTYDAAGYRETATEQVGAQSASYTYGYDKLGRLTSVAGASPAGVVNDTITYDQYGNRRTYTANDVTKFYEHNNLQQTEVIKATDANGAVLASFNYDDNGNLLTKIEGSTTVLSLVYDGWDRTVQADKTGLPTELYAYSGVNRVRKTVGSTVTDYLYSGPDIIAEYVDGNTTAAATYAHGPMMDEPLARMTAANDAYYHSDGHGSIVLVTNTASAATGSALYSAWGESTYSSGTIEQYGYTGRQPDATGLVNYRARYYDPAQGRFTQPDPKGFIDGINRYAYAMNSPVNYVDPWGTSAQGSTPSSNTAGMFETGLSLGLDVLPVVGSLKSLAQVFTGTDLVTGEKVDRWSEGLGVLLGAIPAGKLLLKSEKVVDFGQSVAKNADNVTVYRGVSAKHPGLAEAQQGKATPRGGHSDPARHNEYNTQSEFTSWTTDPKVAERFASTQGSGGVVLKQSVDRNSLVRSPDIYKEKEVLRQGPVSGATVIQQ